MFSSTALVDAELGEYPFSPLGRAVIGGVITSTFLTLLVIPTGYEILDEWRQKFSRLVGRTPKQMTAEHPIPATGD